MILQSVTKAVEDQPPFELKGGLFTLTVMHLRQPDREAVEQHLAVKVRQAPGFFKNAPLVIDLEGLAPGDAPIDFAALSATLRERGLIPVGVRNAGIEQQAAAMLAGLPILPEGRGSAATKKPDGSEPAPAPRTKVVTQQVRSGQQIYAPNGDLILLGAISAGAEVLADGNIHIYGTLRGRALAGVKGDETARIFCQNLQAELVAIAGHYRISEQLDEQTRGQPVQIYLAGDRLLVEPLSR